MKKLRLLSTLFLCCIFTYSPAQNPIPIKVKKNNAFYFHQKDKTDTISPFTGNLFYLGVSDSLKPHLTILLENAQLVKTKNDSVFKLVYVYGINYECSYLKNGEEKNSKKETAPKYSFKSLVNGASSLPKNQIRIIFKIEGRPASLWEGKFYFRN